jgi:hypothetical protein
MGSFATSLHVRSSDADRVATTLSDILVEGGWRPTQSSPSRESEWPGPGPLRALQISAARDGWVSILDSDLMGSHTLAPTIARKLVTHAIFVFVNDSDGWSYLVADSKGTVSEFDSEDNADGDEDDFGDGDLVETGAAMAQIQALMRDGSIMQRMQDVQSRMAADAPPEIRDALQRIRTGQGSTADMQQYQAWAAREMPKYMAEMKSLLGGIFNLPHVSPESKSRQKSRRKATKAEQAARRKRLDPLRPLFAPGVNDEQVHEVLGKRTTFAEDVLAEFLPLLGIADFYANLNYRYLNESTTGELASHNIRFVQHLRFETNQPPLRVFS